MSPRDSERESKQRFPLSREFVLLSLPLPGDRVGQVLSIAQRPFERKRQWYFLSPCCCCCGAVSFSVRCSGKSRWACLPAASLSLSRRRRGSVLAGLVNNGRFFPPSSSPPLSSLSVFTACFGSVSLLGIEVFWNCWVDAEGGKLGALVVVEKHGAWLWPCAGWVELSWVKLCWLEERPSRVVDGTVCDRSVDVVLSFGDSCVRKDLNEVKEMSAFSVRRQFWLQIAKKISEICYMLY